MDTLVEARILVIDDEADIRDMMTDILGFHISKVDTASNAQMALQKISETSYDLVISDVMMPDMSGLDLLKTLRGKKLKCPVIFVSASDSEETLVKALEYGAADFVSKPFQNDELVRLALKMVALGKLANSA